MSSSADIASLIEQLGRSDVDLAKARSLLSTLFYELTEGSISVAELFGHSGADRAIAAAFASHADDSSVAQASCNFFGLAAKSNTTVVALRSSGLPIEAPVKVLSYHEDPPTCAAAMSITRVLGTRPAEAASVLTLDALKVIVAAMHRFRDVVEFQLHALRLFLCLIPHDRSGEQLMEAGAVEAIAAAVHAFASNSVVGDAGPTTLAHIAMAMPSDEAEARAAEFASLAAAVLKVHAAAAEAAGAVDKPGRTVPSHDEVCEHALTALAILGQHFAPAAAALADGGHSFAIIQAVRRLEADRSDALNGCAIVAAMAADTAHHTRLTVAGAVPAVVAAMRLHEADEEVVAKACVAVRLLSREDVSNQQLFQSEGAAPVLAGLLRRYLPLSAVALSYICAAMQALQTEAVREELMAEGVVPLLAEAIERFPAVVGMTRWAVATLAELLKTHADTMAAARSPTLRVVLAAMQRHADHRGLVYSGLHLLTTASPSSEPRAMLVAAGAPELIAQLLQLHAADEGIAQAGTVAFAFLCRGQPSARFSAMVESGAVRALVQGLQRFGRLAPPDYDDSPAQQIAEASLEALALVATVPELRATMLAQGTVPAVAATMIAHAANLRVATAGIKILQLLTEDVPRGASAGGGVGGGKKGKTKASAAAAAASAAAAGAGDGRGGVAFDTTRACIHVSEAAGAALAVALDQHGESTDIARRASLTLCKISTVKAARPALATAQVLSAVSRMLRRHKEEASMVMATVAILNYLADVPAALPLFARAGVVPALVVALRTVADEENIALRIACTCAMAAEDQATCELMARLNVDTELEALRTRYGAGSATGKSARAATASIARVRAEMAAAAKP